MQETSLPGFPSPVVASATMPDLMAVAPAGTLLPKPIRRLVLGASGNDPVYLLDEHGKDLFAGMAITSLTVQVLPDARTTVHVGVLVDTVEAQVAPEAVTKTGPL